MEPREASRRRMPSLDAVWAVLAVALPFAGAVIRPTQALDLAYHIRAGEWMLDHRALMDTDIFSYTVPGAPWLNQQWAAQLALAAVFDAGGWLGLDLLRGAMAGVIALLVYRSCRAVGGSPRTSSLLTIGGALVALEIVSSLRPQLFGCLWFAVVLWCVSTRTTHRGRLWLVPAVTLLWANTHGTFPLALIVVGFAVIEDRRRDPVRARQGAWVLALSLAATFLTPYGIRVWTYIADLSRHPIVASRIAEWQSPSVESGTGILFFFSVASVVVFLARRADRLPWIPLAKIITYGGLSMLALRGVVWWALAVPVVIAELLADGGRERTEDRSPVNVVAMGVVFVLVVISLTVNRGTDPVSGGPAMLRYAPERLVEALRREVPPGARVFASQFHAPWAELSAPGYLYPVDSRIELFPIEVWDEYSEISEGREGWQAMLDADGVEALLLDPDQAGGLIEALDGDEGWRLVEEGSDGRVYVRT